MRVMDYKFKFGSKLDGGRQESLSCGLRGETTAAAILFLLGKAKKELEDPRSPGTQIEASFYYIASRWNDGPLVTTIIQRRRIYPVRSAKKSKRRLPNLPEEFNPGNFLSNRENTAGIATSRKSAARITRPVFGGRRTIRSRARIGNCAKKIRKKL